MASFNIEYYSNCLHRAASFKMVIPGVDRRTDSFPPQELNECQKGRTKTLFLLHGYTGKGDCWIPEYLCEIYNFAVVCPNGENGFWLNGLSTGHAFQTLVGEELVDFVRKTFNLAQNPDETYIMGLSMGGFGALHTALAYPEVFGKTCCLSSALIHHEVATMKPNSDGAGNGVANYAYYNECFGDPSKVLESENNPETLVDKILAAGGKVKMPEIFMACGTEDFLLEPNRAMHNFLQSRNVTHTYWEDSGNHDMLFWDKCVKKFIPIMFKN
jgi:putative tributyrin esterase